LTLLSHKLQKDVSGESTRNVISLQMRAMQETTADIFETLKQSWPLWHCDNFVDDSMNRLRFSDEESRIRVVIAENG
jgi:hypothetical protein